MWNEAGNAEPLRGRDAVIGRFASATSAGVDTSATELHDIVANDDHTIALIRATLRRGDQQVSYPVVEVAHVRDGLVTERWSMLDAVPTDVDEFFSGLSG